MSPRRPLILRRRKLPFQQNDPPPAKTQSRSGASDAKAPSWSDSQCFPDGIRILDHPSMSDTQVVVIPRSADLQSVIGALTAKGKESGVKGPNKFILLSGNDGRESGSLCQSAEEGDVRARKTLCRPVKEEFNPDSKPLTGLKTLNKDVDCGRLDDSLTNIQWLGKMSTCSLEADALNKENQKPKSQPCEHTSGPEEAQDTEADAEASPQQPHSERPPYSYMAMIQFAINSRKDRRMTLKEIYTWIEDHFPYFREVAKPGWKNSIRHNLSLHDMFIREASPDDKVSFWTIRPEVNRCLTLDQVFKPDSDPVAAAAVPVPLVLLQPQKRILPDPGKTPTSSERRMKPLLPRTDSYFVPIQLPVVSSVFLPSPQFPSCLLQKANTSRAAKRVRIAPKVTQSDVPASAMCPLEGKDLKVELKEEPVCLAIKCETPKSTPKRQSSSSRRKQRLVHARQEEPVLLCPESTFFDSGVACDGSMLQDVRDAEPDEQEQPSPDRELSFKTPIKNSSHLTSSTPSKPPRSLLPVPWKVTPAGKGGDSVLDFSPIRTPGGPAVTPRHDYTTFSFSGSPAFEDLPLFNSPRELLAFGSSRAARRTDSPVASCLRSSCSRELLQADAVAPANRSLTEGLVLDTMNDSLSKILVDISFSGLDDDDLGAANISWSEFIPQFK